MATPDTAADLASAELIADLVRRAVAAAAGGAR